MTTKELMEILEGYDPESEVTLVFHNGGGVQLSGVDMVCDNAGPSIYAEGWRADVIDQCAKEREEEKGD